MVPLVIDGLDLAAPVRIAALTEELPPLYILLHRRVGGKGVTQSLGPLPEQAG